MVDLHLDGVARHYGETTALAGVDLDVADGEFFTLVGPSGCGKTTTLRLVAGFESPDAGEIRFGDADQTGVPPEDRDVGIVFQSYALFPHMNVGENVAYGLRFRDPPGGVTTDERVAELLELVDLAEMRDRDPGALSGGQQQRVALARALAPGPEVLLLDEPMSALDARLRERLRLQVRRIQRDLGITTVYVTHDQAEALAISDRLAVMHDGSVEQVGTPEAVYREPRTRFVAEFVGDNNVLTGTVVARDAGTGTAAADSDGGRRGRENRDGTDTPGDRDGTAGSDGRHGTTTDERHGTTTDGRHGPAAGGDLGLEVADTVLSVADLDAAPGDRVTVCVRPEHLAPDATENRLLLTVDTAEFLGDTTRYHCTWTGGDGRTVTLRSPADLEGDVRVGFDPADVRVLQE